MDVAARANQKQGSRQASASAAEFAGLLARIAHKRDRGAFERLFLHFGPRIKALLMSQGADADLAEDVMQDAMAAVWTKARLYTPSRGTPGAWIFTIARNMRIDRIRRQSSQPYVDIEDCDIAATGMGGDELMTVRQQETRVTKAVAELPQKQRQVILMSFVEDLP
ncbi:MAG: sigma-70 family RNA polymerase sigma factor, partial [Pseudomonadota bacterium]|nr:sigma-70 family RNA polymerase sigma factor [Pseudomonadota bacterium]